MAHALDEAWAVIKVDYGDHVTDEDMDEFMSIGQSERERAEMPEPEEEPLELPTIGRELDDEDELDRGYRAWLQEGQDDGRVYDYSHLDEDEAARQTMLDQRWNEQPGRARDYLVTQYKQSQTGIGSMIDNWDAFGGILRVAAYAGNKQAEEKLAEIRGDVKEEEPVAPPTDRVRVPRNEVGVVPKGDQKRQTRARVAGMSTWGGMGDDSRRYNPATRLTATTGRGTRSKGDIRLQGSRSKVGSATLGLSEAQIVAQEEKEYRRGASVVARAHKRRAEQTPGSTWGPMEEPPKGSVIVTDDAGKERFIPAASYDEPHPYLTNPLEEPKPRGEEDG